MPERGRNVVVHDAGVWLPRTKTWLYNLVTSTPDTWEAWVLANRTQNLEEFPYPNLWSLRERYGRLRWTFEMVLRRSHLCAHAPSLLRFAKGLGPSILHSHFGTVGWLNLGFARKLGCRHAVSFYGFDVTMVPRSNSWRRRYLKMFRQADRFLCEGPHMAESLERLGCPAEKISLFRLGVELDKLPYAPRRPGSDGILRFLMAASFREKKGLAYGLDAIDSWAKRNPSSRWELTIIGGASESEESKAIDRELRDKVERFGMQDKVRWCGFLEHAEVLAIAQDHHIFVSPSVEAASGDTEGGAPVAISEMAAMGLVILSTTHCDIPNVLGPENRRLLVPERDADGLAAALDALTGNVQAWHEIAEGNRRHVERLFDSRLQGQRLAQIYDDMMATSG